MKYCDFCGELTRYEKPEPELETACYACTLLIKEHIYHNLNLQDVKNDGIGVGTVNSKKYRDYRKANSLYLHSAPWVPTIKESAMGILLPLLASKFYPAITSPSEVDSFRYAAFIARHTSLVSDRDKEILDIYARTANARSVQGILWCNECCLHILPSYVCDCGACKRCGTNCSQCGSCKSCCRCVHCSVCTRPALSFACRECSSCNRCCGCPKCSSCGEKADLCEGCERCRTCCYCNKPHEIRPVGNKHWTDEKSRLTGLEIEFNNCFKEFTSISKWSKKWDARVHADGSCGWECVTAPAAGKFLTGQLKELEIALKDSGAKANESCGVHVHVDARDLNMHAIRRLSYLYGLVEPVMYAIAGQNRVENHYCEPNGDKLKTAAFDTKRWSRLILKAIYKQQKGTDSELKSMLLYRSGGKRGPHKKDGARYAGMNLCPWVSGRINHSMDTTVEFRIHKNCLKADRLNHWANVCGSLLDYAKSSSWKDVTGLPKDAARSLCIVAPREASWIVDRLRIWRSVVGRKSRKIKYSPKTGWSILGYGM